MGSSAKGFGDYVYASRSEEDGYTEFMPIKALQIEERNNFVGSGRPAVGASLGSERTNRDLEDKET